MIFEFNNKAYLEEVLELVNESVAVLSKNMEVVRFNKASKELFGAEDLAVIHSLRSFTRRMLTCLKRHSEKLLLIVAVRP